MTRRALLLFLAALVAVTPAWSKKKDRDNEEPAPPESGAHVERFEGGVRIDAVLPGTLFAYALPLTSDGKREIFLLGRQPAPEEEDGGDERSEIPPCPGEAGDEDSGPVLLFRFEIEGEGDLELLDENLPADSTALETLDLDDDGRDELLLVREGIVEVLTLSDGGGGVDRRVLIEDADLHRESLAPAVVRHPFLEGHRGFGVAVLGGFKYYAPGADGREWGLQASLPVPVEAERQGWGLRVYSPIPQPVGVRNDGGVVYASTPEEYGERRLRVLRLEPGAVEGSRVVEAWCRLPEPEEVLGRGWIMLDGRPVLAVTTRRADKLALFGERRLRLWFLEPDRSSTGLDPFFAVETRINLWQDERITVRDANRDGIDDLVVGYWKGILKSKIVLDVYLRREDGTFDPKPRTTGFDVKDGDWDVLDYGHDLDGDGVADLVLRARGDFQVHRGIASSTGKKLVETASSVTLPRARWGGSRPRMVDLDGDGRAEVVVARRSGERAGLQVYRLDQP